MKAFIPFQVKESTSLAPGVAYAMGVDDDNQARIWTGGVKLDMTGEVGGLEGIGDDVFGLLGKIPIIGDIFNILGKVFKITSAADVLGDDELMGAVDELKGVLEKNPQLLAAAKSYIEPDDA